MSNLIFRRKDRYRFRGNRRMVRDMAHFAFSVLILTGAACCGLAADIVIPARELSAKSKNVVAEDSTFSGLVVCHGRNGMQQWQFDLQQSGRQLIHVYYTSAPRK